MVGEQNALWNMLVALTTGVSGSCEIPLGSERFTPRLATLADATTSQIPLDVTKEAAIYVREPKAVSG
ncbi:hypothetical protein [Tahibacter sp.]|uniref:hypothetical protein n=1 Tax=Tahibacter sp. TaxID=2056211 RepID=UPI0028C37929|nr:hypothetical protein [Tahibacter sp.]